VLRGSAQRAALLLAGCAALIASGCGSSSKPTETGVRVQREDLIVAAQALRSAATGVEREARATRAAWPAVVDGLPGQASPATRRLVREAALHAAALPLPAPFTEERARALTGAASGLAGTFQIYRGLAGRGWKLIDYSLARLEGGPPAAASFARDNAALYIESVYDAHFAIAQAGKHLQNGYETLGGPEAFGRSLRQAEVNQLAGIYSEAKLRLHPHTGVRLGS
jgi:hypothetical protein